MIPKLKEELQASNRLIKVSIEEQQDILVKPPEPFKTFYSY